MISDRDTVKFMIVDTPSHTSLFLLHKSTDVSHENTRANHIHLFLQSFNFYGAMLSLTEIGLMPDLLPKPEGLTRGSSKNIENFCTTNILQMPELSKGGYE